MRFVINVEMKHTSRDKRSSLATTIEQRVLRAASSAAARLRPALKCVRALAGLNLDMLGDDVDPFGIGEAPDHVALRAEPKPAAALLRVVDTRR